jgi:hypothetical protein
METNDETPTNENENEKQSSALWNDFQSKNEQMKLKEQKVTSNNENVTSAFI